MLNATTLPAAPDCANNPSPPVDAPTRLVYLHELLSLGWISQEEYDVEAALSSEADPGRRLG